MPRLPDIKSVLLIGSGPIVIGQAAEFDYSGSQAARALREEGVRVILVNPNPATIQTDVGTADVVYLEPLTPQSIASIIEREKPDGILPTMAGQTGLNLALSLAPVLAKHNVRVLGTGLRTIELAEDRAKFASFMRQIGQRIPESDRAHSLEEGVSAAKKIGFPVIVRPDFCLGGTGIGIAERDEHIVPVLEAAFAASASHSVLVEKSIAGLAELEYEVIRDAQDNCITICSMENVDPIGVHTGESMVVAPAQTLTDDEHQMLRSAAITIIRALKVEGACNIQFALNQQTGEYWVVEVNPRASRSSALASKATGYPIARAAAKIALGYTLPEIVNPVTGKTACFEPALDYVVVKIPRWPFDKFGMSGEIGTSMKSTGEVMAIGRTFEEAMQKAVRGLELRRVHEEHARVVSHLNPHELRLFKILDELRSGREVAHLARSTHIHPWFLYKFKHMVDAEQAIARWPTEPSWWLSSSCEYALWHAKTMGFSDARISTLCGRSIEAIVLARRRFGIRPTFKMVDTCAAEFQALTPYFYSTYAQSAEEEDASSTPASEPRRKVVILGSGPIRIGQGIEFDYCTVQAVAALREKGFSTVVINNNPETVSTDFDISDRLYFEPVTLEDVLNIVEREVEDCKRTGSVFEGVLVQFGGQTAVNLALSLVQHGVHVLGTSVDAIDIVEDRKRFKQFSLSMGFPLAESSMAYTLSEAKQIADYIGYPVLIRPSYVLGGRAMQVVENEEELLRCMHQAVEVSDGHPIAIDHFISDAIEVDVDVIADGTRTVIAGIMEQIEETGVHSGDSAAVLGVHRISPVAVQKISAYAHKIGSSLRIRGLCNIQMAVMGDEVYVLEVNPRASRTIPFVSKATGVPVARIAALLQAEGSATLDEYIPSHIRELVSPFVAVKVPVFSFTKFSGIDPVAGPEMKSTGEVMALATTFEAAYAKALIAAHGFPTKGIALVSSGKWERSLRLAYQECPLPLYVCQDNEQAIALLRSGKVDALVCGKDDALYSVRSTAARLNIPVYTSSFAAMRLAQTIKVLSEGNVDAYALPPVALNEVYRADAQMHASHAINTREAENK